MKTHFGRTFGLFLAPDGPEGGSGVLAVVDPPADADILSMEAPNLDSVMDKLSDNPTEPVEPKTPEAKVEPKTTPPVKEPPVSQLREELKRTKAELESLKSNVGKDDPRIAEAQLAIKAREEELAAVNGKLSDYQRRLEIASPAVQEAVLSLNDSYNKEAAKFYDRVPEITQATFNDLYGQYAKLPASGTPEYAEARADFESSVRELLGDNDRKLDKVLDFLDHSKEFVATRSEKLKEVHTNARKIQLDADRGNYTKAEARVSKLFAEALEVPAGLETTDPTHPKVILKSLADALGDKAGDLNKGIPEFIKLVLAGTSPRSDDDYVGMTQEQIADSRAEEASRIENARNQAVAVIANGTRALRILPTLMKELRRLQAKTKETAEANPPDPTKTAPDSTSSDDDIRGFKAPSIDSLNF